MLPGRKEGGTAPAQRALPAGAVSKHSGSGDAVASPRDERSVVIRANPWPLTGEAGSEIRRRDARHVTHDRRTSTYTSH
jgi:hypothetical protein